MILVGVEAEKNTKNAIIRIENIKYKIKIPNS